MSQSANPFRAPETQIVEKVVAKRRPFLMFLAAAICGGAAVLFLLMNSVVGLGLVTQCLEDGFGSLIETRLDIKYCVLELMCVAGLFSFSFASRSFFVLRGWRGALCVIAGLISLGLLFATAYWLPDR